MAHPLTQRALNFPILKRELGIKPSETLAFKTFKPAYNDDYWQKGKGSLLPSAQGSMADAITKAMEDRFVYRNVIKEVIDRVAKAYFGKYPNWKYSVQGEEKNREENLDKWLGSFWTLNNIGKELSKAFSSRLLTGRGGIRIYVSKKYIYTNENGETFLQTFPSIEEALKAIKVEFIDPEKSRLLKDDSELFSIIEYERRENWDTEELIKIIEFSFVDDNELTYIGTIRENDKNIELSEGLPLNGFTTFFEIKGEPYITSALYKNNQLLNLALTCSGFSLIDNGFGEVFLTNVEMETTKVKAPDGSTIEQPQKLKRGGGVVQNLIGISSINDDGSESIQTPGVHFKEPTSIEVFKSGKDLAYTACLEEASQLYAKISGDATASGESRIQAMKDFYLRIEEYKSEVDQLGSWLLSTTLRLAGILAGQEFPVDVIYDAKIFVGDISTAEKSSLLAQYQAGVISLETCRVLTGIDDPDLEQELVTTQNTVPFYEASLDEKTRRVALANQLIGLLPEHMIRTDALGYSDAEADTIQAMIYQEAEMNLQFGQREQFEEETQEQEQTQESQNVEA